MLGANHLAVGFACGVLADGLGVLPLNAETLPPLLLGSLLPDVDHPKSLLGRRFFFVSGVVHMTVGHRGATHSIFALAAVLVGGFLLLSPDMALALSLGFTSHLLADAMTKGGVPILWPRKTKLHLLPTPFKTGSLAEYLVTGVILGLSFLCNPSAMQLLE
jgi:inner membrane protein